MTQEEMDVICEGIRDKCCETGAAYPDLGHKAVDMDLWYDDTQFSLYVYTEGNGPVGTPLVAGPDEMANLRSYVTEKLSRHFSDFTLEIILQEADF